MDVMSRSDMLIQRVGLWRWLILGFISILLGEVLHPLTPHYNTHHPSFYASSLLLLIAVKCHFTLKSPNTHFIYISSASLIQLSVTLHRLDWSNFFLLHNKNVAYVFACLRHMSCFEYVWASHLSCGLGDKHMVTWAASTISSGSWVPYVTLSGIRDCSNTLGIDLFIYFL